MYQELMSIQERLQPHLKEGDFSFIGPIDQKLMTPFIKQVNDVAPVVGPIRLLRHALGNKKAVEAVLHLLPTGTQLRIYVVHGNALDALLHDTVEGYCSRNGLDFKI